MTIEVFTILKLVGMIKLNNGNIKYYYDPVSDQRPCSLSMI